MYNDTEHRILDPTQQNTAESPLEEFGLNGNSVQILECVCVHIHRTLHDAVERCMLEMCILLYLHKDMFRN